MSLRMAGGGPESVRFPRVSGDEPHPAAAALFADGFSPRERG